MVQPYRLLEISNVLTLSVTASFVAAVIVVTSAVVVVAVMAIVVLTTVLPAVLDPHPLLHVAVVARNPCVVAIAATVVAPFVVSRDPCLYGNPVVVPVAVADSYIRMDVAVCNNASKNDSADNASEEGSPLLVRLCLRSGKRGENRD